MEALFNPLIFLPIHRHSKKDYYEKHRKWVQPKKEHIEEQYGKPFNQLSHETQVQWEMRWYWPPWKFNDIVGYLDIGMDGGDCMTADIYLKRKWLPRHLKRRIPRRAAKAAHLDVRENHEMYHYYEIGKARVDLKENSSYQEALKQILKNAKGILEKHPQKLQLWLPPFDSKHFDFVKAYKKYKEATR